MAKSKERSRKSPAKNKSLPKRTATPPIGQGGEVRVPYVKSNESPNVTAPAVAGFGVVPPTKLEKQDFTPEGKLELNKEYALKDEMFAIITGRMKGSDPGMTPMVTWKKGFTQPDHSVEWAPEVQAVEKGVEQFIFNNLEEKE